MSNFPNSRPRRNRQSPWIRELLAENRLHSSDLIMPFFVIDGKNKKEAIKTFSYVNLIPISFYENIYSLHLCKLFSYL